MNSELLRNNSHIIFQKHTIFWEALPAYVIQSFRQPKYLLSISYLLIIYFIFYSFQAVDYGGLSMYLQMYLVKKLSFMNQVNAQQTNSGKLCSRAREFVPLVFQIFSELWQICFCTNFTQSLLLAFFSRKHILWSSRLSFRVSLMNVPPVVCGGYLSRIIVTIPFQPGTVPHYVLFFSILQGR